MNKNHRRTAGTASSEFQIRGTCPIPDRRHRHCLISLITIGTHSSILSPLLLEMPFRPFSSQERTRIASNPKRVKTRKVAMSRSGALEASTGSVPVSQSNFMFTLSGESVSSEEIKNFTCFPMLMMTPSEKIAS